jgi:hypothetical protein
VSTLNTTTPVLQNVQAKNDPQHPLCVFARLVTAVPGV